MRFLVVTNMYPTEKMPFYGIFVKEQVDSLRREGISVDVFFINGRENRLNYFKSVMGLLKGLKSNKYDIIHAHHTYCVYPIMIAKVITRTKTPVILTFHEGEVHKRDGIKERDIDLIKRLVFSKRIKKFALRMVDLVITVQEELIKALNFKGEYQVIPCGVDLELFRPMDKQWCREKLKLSLKKKIIFFPAAPEDENKGFYILREALKNLERTDVELITAGNINHSDIPIYMNAADIVVQLSEFEASPMVLKEAMAVNTTVVFTDVGDARTLVAETRGCYLCSRTPDDVATTIKDALKSDGNSEGRKRIVQVRLGLSEIAKQILESTRAYFHHKGF
jgi:teichuronic acid biosynthesis glycosyltransferase TuaC